MQQYKFRIWDDLKKKMIFPEAIMFEWFQGQIIALYEHEEDKGLFVNIADDMQLEQGIGMKDFFGQDIYVGDIVKIPNFDLVFAVREQQAGVTQFPEGIEGDDIEVLGNIHQSNEVLENG